MKTPKLPVNSSLLVVAAAAAAIMVPAGPAEAESSVPRAADFGGTWRHVGDAREAEQRKQAIERATEDLSIFVRGMARDRIAERTAPSSELMIEVVGGRLKLSGKGGKSLSVELGGKPTILSKDGKKGTVSARMDDGRLVVVTKGEGSQRTATYALSSDRGRLSVTIRMKGGKLPGVLEYRSTYRRGS